MTTPAGPPRAAPAWLLLAVATLSAATLSANLLLLAGARGCTPSLSRCALGDGPWAQPDSVGYLRLARRIRADGFGSVTWERRTPGYPLVLAASLGLTGASLPALWLAVPLGALAAAASAWLAGFLSGRRSAAACAGCLFAVWPDVLAFAPLLLTDGLHAFLAVCALAATLAWRESGRGVWALAAGLAWAAAQALRPSLFGVAPLVALLLWTRPVSRRAVSVSAALCAATLLVPAGVTASNWLRLGLAAPSIKLAYAAACESVPMLKQRQGLARHRVARNECRERQRALSSVERVRAQRAEARAYLAAHPLETAHMLVDSALEQLLYPASAVHRPDYAHLLPTWLGIGSRGMALFWAAAFGGWLLAWRRDRRLALFLAGSFAMLMGPASLVHTAGARYRLPAELLLLPGAVVLVDHAVRALAARLRARRAAQA